MIRPVGFDHLVLRVADVERSLEFYSEVLGMESLRVTEWRDGKVMFPSARISPTAIIDFFETAPDGQNLDHFCVVVDSASVQAALDDPRLTVIDGPGTRWGAQGDATSVYVEDPDGNVVELRSYAQPAAQ